MIEQRKTASSEALLSSLSKQLSDTNKLLSELITAEEIDELTDAIAGASKVHFYIPFRTSFIYSFQQNLWIDGKNSEYQCLLPQMLSATRYLDDRSITLISTIEHAETQDMTRIFESVKETGSTIWLTGNAESRYADYADRLLLVSKAPAAVWLIAFELFILALSERYRSRFIDK
jgi:DNA-binding MurR/RpiR family transcriptional regulator